MMFVMWLGLLPEKVTAPSSAQSRRAQYQVQEDTTDTLLHWCTAVPTIAAPAHMRKHGVQVHVIAAAAAAAATVVGVNDAGLQALYTSLTAGHSFCQLDMHPMPAASQASSRLHMGWHCCNRQHPAELDSLLLF
jgi:hypothetical protein